MAFTHFLIQATSIAPSLRNMPDKPARLEIDMYPRMTEEEFYAFCSGNPDLRIEQDKHGKLIIMTPVGFDGGLYEAEAFGELRIWHKKAGKGKCLSHSAGFRLPDGSTHSADGAWVTDEKVEALAAEQRKKFAPIVPDFVIEVRSSSDRLPKLKRKMTDTWIKNGVRLAWLIDPLKQKAIVYRQDGSIEHFDNFDCTLSGEEVCPGFELDLRGLKAV